MRTQEQRNKSKNLLLNTSKEIDEMKEIGMNSQTIISNINFLLEPVVGFDSALKICSHVEEFLKQKKEKTFAEYFVSWSKEQSAKENSNK